MKDVRTSTHHHRKNRAGRVWLNFNHRSLIRSGRLEQLIERDQVTGVISDAPAAADCIARDREYRDGIRKLAASGVEVEEIYRNMALEDAIRAADLLLPVFKKSKGRDGLVGIDVSPEFAYDVEALMDEGRSLWERADRPNVMIQIPATEEAVPAIKALLRLGINVNATLLNSAYRYQDIARAYVGVLVDQQERRGSAGGVVSAATISAHPGFERLPSRTSADGTIDILWHISSSTALSAIRTHREIFGSRRFQELAATGAQPQLLMWIDEANDAQRRKDHSIARELSSKLLEQICDGHSPQKAAVPETASGPTEYGGLEWFLDVMQEETIKSQVVRTDRALESLKRIQMDSP
jgi:hypothetical protein